MIFYLKVFISSSAFPPFLVRERGRRFMNEYLCHPQKEGTPKPLTVEGQGCGWMEGIVTTQVSLGTVLKSE